MKELKASITVVVTDDEAALFNSILEQTDQDLKLKDIFGAAAEEYVRMVLAQHTFSRGSDANEYRLLLLTKYAFGGVLPSEQAVSALFQVTLTRARTMISNVVAKYQHRLQSVVTSSLKQCLADSEEQEDADELIIRSKSEAVIQLLMEKVKQLDGNHPQIRRTNRVGEYLVAPSVRDALLAMLDE